MSTASTAQRLVGSSLLALMLTSLWVCFTADISPPNLLVAVAFGITLAFWMTPVPRRDVRVNWLYVLPFGLWLLWKLTQSSVEVAIEVVRPTPRRAPAIIDVPLDLANDSQITLLSHVLTLTPGTMVMGLSRDRRALRLHGMFVAEPQLFISEIKREFERRVLKVLPCRQS
jgi:multicomponent Na+:H+ antiporter subunit E